MKLSQMRNAYMLVCERQNLIGMVTDLDDIIAGEMEDDGEVYEPNVEVSVHGWRIEVPAERVPDLIELARDAAHLQIADIERKLAALGVEIDADADVDEDEIEEAA